MQFLLDWPVPLSFLTVSVVAAAIALSGLYVVRKKYPTEVLKENHEVAAIIFNAFGLFYGVMVAFVVFVTWSGYSDATKNLEMEANEVADIFHGTQAFPDPARRTIRQGLMDYVVSVYGDELKRMAQGEIALHSGKALPTLLTEFYQMDEKSIPNRELYAETLDRLNDLAQYRRLRIFAGNDIVPLAIWLVLLVGAVFTIWRDGPLSDDLERLPRLAESAAPAAICCFFDFAGIQKGFASQSRIGFISVAANFRQKKYAGTPVKTMRIPIPEVAGARKPRSMISNPASQIEMIGTNG